MYIYFIQIFVRVRVCLLAISLEKYFTGLIQIVCICFLYQTTLQVQFRRQSDLSFRNVADFGGLANTHPYKQLFGAPLQFKARRIFHISDCVILLIYKIF